MPAVSVIPQAAMSSHRGMASCTRSSSTLGPMRNSDRRLDSASGSNSGWSSSGCMMAGNQGKATVARSRLSSCSARPGSKYVSVR